MAAGITDKLWSVEDIVALVEAAEPKPGKRGPYKKRVAAEVRPSDHLAQPIAGIAQSAIEIRFAH
jgi:hypothetical protein